MISFELHEDGFLSVHDMCVWGEGVIEEQGTNLCLSWRGENTEMTKSVKYAARMQNNPCQNGLQGPPYPLLRSRAMLDGYRA